MSGVLVAVLAMIPRGERGAAAQTAAPAYSPPVLACAVFVERVDTRIVTRRQGVSAEEAAGREGIVVVLASAASGGGLRFTAWYDSLAVWRDASGGRLAPDTDGLVGARWRGSLGPAGQVSLDQRPYLPPEVMAVADLTEQFADFFPPLAPVPLSVGAEWRDSLGLTIARLPDGEMDGVQVIRSHWLRQQIVPADSAVMLMQRVTDEGELEWDPDAGPLGWARSVVVEAETAGTVSGAPPLQTTVEQQMTVRQITSPELCR